MVRQNIMVGNMWYSKLPHLMEDRKQREKERDRQTERERARDRKGLGSRYNLQRSIFQ
jgi:hypothetical protein